MRESWNQLLEWLLAIEALSRAGLAPRNLKSADTWTN